jgi:hypothetical protein
MIEILKQTFEFAVMCLLDSKTNPKKDGPIISQLLKEMEAVVQFIFKIETREQSTAAAISKMRRKRAVAYHKEKDKDDSTTSGLDKASSSDKDKNENNTETSTNKEDAIKEPISFHSFPLEGNWQKGYQRELSKRTLLMCLANNVTVFSGYEDNEFTLEILYRKRASGFFGVKLWERYAGYLPSGSEQLLSKVWHLIAEDRDDLFSASEDTDEKDDEVTDPLLDFDAELERVRESEWFLAKTGKFINLTKKGRIARLGEHDGLDLLLCFTLLLLLKARVTENPKDRDELVKNAMSMALPVVSEVSWIGPVYTHVLERFT